MLKISNTKVTIQGKVLESFESKRFKNVYYTKVSVNNEFKELYLKEQLEEGKIYNIKGEIDPKFIFIINTVIAKVN